MMYKLCVFCFTAVEVFLSFQVTDLLMEPKRGRGIRWFVMAVLMLAEGFLIVNNQQYAILSSLQIFIFVLVNGGIKSFVYKGRWYSLLLLDGITWLVFLYIDLALVSFLPLFWSPVGLTQEMLVCPGAARCWYLAALMVLYAGVVALARVLIRRHSFCWAQWTVLEVFLLAVLVVAEFRIHNVYIPGSFREGVSGWWFPVLVVTVFAVIFTGYQVKNSRETKRKLEGLKTEMAIQNYQKQKELYEAHATLFHDMKNHFYAIRSMAENNKGGEICTYIDKLYSPLQRAREGVKTQNEVFDFMINTKSQEAGSKGIRMEVKADPLFDAGMEFGEIVTVFGNLLDNAIEACELMPEGQRWIMVKCAREARGVFVVIQNSWEKELEEERKKQKEGDLHGRGLRGVEQVLKRYSGYMGGETLVDRYQVELQYYCGSSK